MILEEGRQKHPFSTSASQAPTGAQLKRAAYSDLSLYNPTAPSRKPYTEKVLKFVLN
jgi:hypothetical protein